MRLPAAGIYAPLFYTIAAKFITLLFSIRGPEFLILIAVTVTVSNSEIYIFRIILFSVNSDEDESDFPILPILHDRCRCRLFVLSSRWG